MFQFVSLIVEHGKQKVIGIFIKHKPRRTEGVLEVTHHMNVTGRSVSLCEKESFLSI